MFSYDAEEFRGPGPLTSANRLFRQFRVRQIRNVRDGRRQVVGLGTASAGRKHPSQEPTPLRSPVDGESSERVNVGLAALAGNATRLKAAEKWGAKTRDGLRCERASVPCLHQKAEVERSLFWPLPKHSSALPVRPDRRDVRAILALSRSVRPHFGFQQVDREAHIGAAEVALGGTMAGVPQEERLPASHAGGIPTRATRFFFPRMAGSAP